MTTEAEVRETHRGRWPMVAWVLFGLVTALLIAGTVTGVFMRAALLDIVSFWPAWVLALLVSLALWPLSRRGVTRIGAVLPLLLFSWILGALSLHFQMWELLPSASADLAGPPAEGVTVAGLTLIVDGELQLGTGEGALYTVTVNRQGGDVAPPEGLERVADGEATVELRERAGAGWFGSSGWTVEVARTASWDVSVVARHIDADLRGVGVRSLSATADGTIRLGAPAADLEMVVDGDLEIVIPNGVAVEVSGSAQVPPGWLPTESGVRFEAEGPVLRITTQAVRPILIRQLSSRP